MRLGTTLLAALVSSGALCAQAKPLRIIATIPDLASIAKAVGKDRVQVTSIIVGARDPHRIEAKPSFISRAASSDVWLAVGIDLEVGYEPLILEGARNRRIVPGAPGHIHASQWVPIRDVPSGPVTRAMGDIHPEGNPHIWLDPFNGRTIALRLAERLGEIAPSDLAYFRSNAETFARQVDEAMFGAALVAKFGGARLWDWDNNDKLVENLRSEDALALLGGWAAKMRPHWGKPVVTYHRSWPYFASRFGLKVVAELEPKPGIEPTPGHVANVIKTVQQRSVKAILQEPFYSTRNGKFVAGRTGAELVVVPQSVGQVPSAGDYIGLFDVLVGKISAALGK